MVLNVGITGHRASALTPPLVRALRPIVYTVFLQLRDAAVELQQAEERFCSDTAVTFRLHTPLATGADQLGAICARSSGFVVEALLPFEPAEYRNDFAAGDELDGFEQALEAVDNIVALPGDRSDPVSAYVMVGKSLVLAADVLVALWDGEQARGPGGTAHVVELAIEAAVPVIHVEVNPTGAVRVRTLVGGEPFSSSGESLIDAQLYQRALRSAFRLDVAPARPGPALFA